MHNPLKNFRPLGTVVIIKTEIKDKMYVLINIYAPNKDASIASFLNNLLVKLQKNNLDEEENIIMDGDFNCPLNPSIDKKGGLLNPRKVVISTISNLQEELYLVNSWRVKNPEKKSLTWSQNSLIIFCRLNYWLISNALLDLVKGTDTIPAIRTDHSAITLEFVNSLFDDDEYVNVITESIPIWLAQGHKDLTDYGCILDWLKYNVRDRTIQYSKKRAQERKEKEKRFQEQYTNAKCTFETNPNNLNANLLNSAKDTLELFSEEKVKGIIEGFGGKRALGFLLKSELCQKCSKFRMQFCLRLSNNALHVFPPKFASFLKYYVCEKTHFSKGILWGPFIK